MRFILNFCFYGILFYILYLVFPDAFFQMVEWARNITELLYGMYGHLAAKLYEWRRGGQLPAPYPFEQAWPYLWPLIARRCRRLS